MSKAIAIVAHHDDHVLWMGGTTQRLTACGWQWTVVAMCVPDRTRREYFVHCCSVFGAVPVYMEFQDYSNTPFSVNNRAEMRSRLVETIQDQRFELVFTHSRRDSGEYWLRHANHVEVCDIVSDLVVERELGPGRQGLAYFDYDVIYGSGTATCARLNANYVLPLTYRELLWKCQLSSQAPDVNSSLKNLAFPCPNPEGFEGDKLVLPKPLIGRRL